jgi:hypothetical protein
MAKFSQNTLNQVAGFNGQILAQELVFNQRDFWNISWATVNSSNSGWETSTTPVNLTGATIDATIVRRAIVDYHDSRTGLDFTITDYPLVPLVTEVTESFSSNDSFQCVSTKDLYVDQPIQFTGIVFGGVSTNTTYYVKDILSKTTFTISATSGGLVFALSDDTGSMEVVKPDPTPISLPITNVNNANGSFTLTIDDDTWGIIAGDPDLNINSCEPACFTGRIKISFPAVGTQPAYDESVFLLFLITSDGVINYG